MSSQCPSGGRTRCFCARAFGRVKVCGLAADVIVCDGWRSVAAWTRRVLCLRSRRLVAVAGPCWRGSRLLWAPVGSGMGCLCPVRSGLALCLPAGVPTESRPFDPQTSLFISRGFLCHPALCVMSDKKPLRLSCDWCRCGVSVSCWQECSHVPSVGATCSYGCGAEPVLGFPPASSPSVPSSSPLD